MPEACPVYRSRKPHLTPFYQCVQDHYETLEQVYPERFAKRYGFWRPYLKEIMVNYLSCGDVHEGFARIRCDACGTERVLAFSCKERKFCPSCGQKRAVEFGEWLCGHVLRAVPHRHWVFSIPKILRRFFLHDRKLLVELSRCAWESLKTFLQAAVPEPQAVPAAVISTQTFGDDPNRFHPHLHVLCPDGCFYGQGRFRVAPQFDVKDLEKLFRVKLLTMLLRKKKITRDFIRMLDGWRHSGFNVFAGQRIQPREKKSLENLAAYLIRATFSQKRMDYSPDDATVVYRSKDGKEKKTYDALDWLAAMASHVPERGKQSIRYYGAYANSVRGKLRKRQEGEPIPTVLEPVISSEARRRNWARLIRKVYETDPLVCPRCQKEMRIVAAIENPQVIRRILEHLGLWLANARPTPRAHSPPGRQPLTEGSYSQLPARVEEDYSQAPPAHWDC